MGSGRSIWRAVIIGGFVWAAAAGAAEAQQQQTPTSRWDVTPFFGAAFGEDIKTTTALGFGAAYRATQDLAFEGELSFLPDIVGDDSSVDASVTSVSFGGQYYYPLQLVDAYGAFGLGFSRFSTEFSSGNTKVDESHTEFSFNLGGGVSRRLSTRTSVRADVRYFNVNDENPNFWRIYGGVTFHLGG
jgi:opacity protein-like surface antigen